MLHPFLAHLARHNSMYVRMYVYVYMYTNTAEMKRLYQSFITKENLKQAVNMLLFIHYLQTYAN